MQNLFIKTEKQTHSKICFACLNDLVGEEKNHKTHEYWVCHCDVPEQTDDPNMESFYCPICNDFLPESTYLKIIFKSENTKLFANMITHYRHHHITSWNKNWEKNGHNYRNSYHFGNYHEEKNKINERAKRQIIKKCKDFIIEHNFEKDDFLNLYYNEDKTIELISKIFR